MFVKESLQGGNLTLTYKNDLDFVNSYVFLNHGM